METNIIHTTVHLTQSLALLLDESAKKLNMKRSELMMLLMRRLLIHWKKMKRSFVTVQYQDNINQEEWKAVHVFLEGKDYEVATDMRKFFKWSVSALLAMAMRLYLNEVLEAGKDNLREYCDNYKMYGYESNGNMNKNNICWQIIWKFNTKFAQNISC